LDASLTTPFNYSFGEDFVYANQRRQGGKEERNSDLLIDRDAAMGGDVDMAVGGKEANSETGKGGLIGEKRLMISGACSASPARCSGSGGPDLLDLKLQTRIFRARFQHRDPFESLRVAAGGPDLHSLFVGNQQPAKPGTVGLVSGHLVAQGQRPRRQRDRWRRLGGRPDRALCDAGARGLAARP